MIIIRFVVDKVTQEIRLNELGKARIVYKALWDVSDVDEEGYPLAEMIGLPSDKIVDYSITALRV